MTEYEVRHAHASFHTDFAGRISAPEREIVLIGNRGEFSAYLGDPVRFFDGRFAYYEEYERDEGAFFADSDLIAVIIRGEIGHAFLELDGDVWKVRLDYAPLARPTLSFIPVPKGGARAELCA